MGVFAGSFIPRFGWRIWFNCASVSYPARNLDIPKGPWRKVVFVRYIFTYIFIDQRGWVPHAVPWIEWGKVCREITDFKRCTHHQFQFASLYMRVALSTEPPNLGRNPHPQSRGICSDEPETVLCASPRRSLDQEGPDRSGPSAAPTYHNTLHNCVCMFDLHLLSEMQTMQPRGSHRRLGGVFCALL